MKKDGPTKNRRSAIARIEGGVLATLPAGSLLPLWRSISQEFVIQE